ncbi:MAG TPA: hypothetical protein V6C81_24190 [Planktothrix sp.]|jgi:hypothetical protein
MNMRFSTIISAVALLLIASAVVCNSQSVNDAFRDMTDSLGPTADSYKDVDARIQKLQSSLTAAKLTAVQSSELTNKISKIATAESQEKSLHPSGLPFSSALTLTRDLNRVAAKLVLISDAPAEAPDPATMRSRLNERIDAALNAILLTQADADKLRRDMQATVSMENGMHSGSSSLTALQVNQVRSAIQDIQAHFAQELKLNQTAIPDLNKAEVDLQMDVDSAERASKIDTKQAATLRQRLDQITAKQSNFIGQNTDGALSSVQVYAIASDIDRLRHQLHQFSTKTVSEQNPPNFARASVNH